MTPRYVLTPSDNVFAGKTLTPLLHLVKSTLNSSKSESEPSRSFNLSRSHISRTVGSPMMDAISIFFTLVLKVLSVIKTTRNLIAESINSEIRSRASLPGSVVAKLA